MLLGWDCLIACPTTAQNIKSLGLGSKGDFWRQRMLAFRSNRVKRLAVATILDFCVTPTFVIYQPSCSHGDSEYLLEVYTPCRSLYEH